MTTQPWRQYLNDEERAELAVLDVEIDAARKTGLGATAKREKIRRRCVQRMRTAVGK